MARIRELAASATMRDATSHTNLNIDTMKNFGKKKKLELQL